MVLDRTLLVLYKDDSVHYLRSLTVQKKHAVQAFDANTVITEQRSSPEKIYKVHLSEKIIAQATGQIPVALENASLEILVHVTFF